MSKNANTTPANTAAVNASKVPTVDDLRNGGVGERPMVGETADFHAWSKARKEVLEAEAAADAARLELELKCESERVDMRMKEKAFDIDQQIRLLKAQRGEDPAETEETADTGEGLIAKTLALPAKGWEYAKENPWKVAAGVGALAGAVGAAAGGAWYMGYLGGDADSTAEVEADNVHHLVGMTGTGGR